MGCVFSKHFGDNNPRFFQVWNVDDHGNQLNPGKIEVTHVALVLHQKGKTPIKWPLKCLRRYGFDAELFSFESGRRCPTGPGIYAFKCRQAEALFNTVQEFIQCRSIPTGNGIASPSNDERVGSVSGPTIAGPLPNSTSSNTIGLPHVIQNGTGPQGPSLNGGFPAPLSVDNVGYLEPIGVTATVAAVAASQPRSSSLGSTTSPMTGLPETGSITAVSPARGSLPGLYGTQALPIPTPVPLSLAAACGCSSCTALARTPVSLPHQYVNSSVVVPEKAATGPPRTLTGQLPPSRVSCGQVTCSVPPSTTIAYVDQNTNYARLDDLLKQEQQHSAKRQKDNNRFYENVTPEPVAGLGSVSILGLTKATRGTPTMSRSSTVTSPTGLTTPKSPVVHFYANLNSPPSVLASAEAVSIAPDTNKALEDDQEPEGSEDEPRVNYITLDLNHSQPLTEFLEPAHSPPATGVVPAPLSPPGSPGNPTEGYATIDFDKTAALSNSSNPGILDDSVRKTRHNSAIPVPISLTLQ